MYVDGVSLRFHPTSRSPPTFPWGRHTFRRCCVIGALCCSRRDSFAHAHLFPLRDSRVVYIPTQVINFAVVPPHLRFVFVGVVSLFWSTFLPRPLFPFRRDPEPFPFVPPDTYLSAVNAKERQLYDVEHGIEKPTET